MWWTGSWNELGTGEVKGTLSLSALCDIGRLWGCTSGKCLDHFRVCVPLGASSLYQSVLASSTYSWQWWFMTQQHFSWQSLWQGFAEKPTDISCAASCPLGLCWRHCSTLRWAILAHANVAGFSGWSGKGGLFIARDISQPRHTDCECLMDLWAATLLHLNWGKTLLNRIASSTVLSLLLLVMLFLLFLLLIAQSHLKVYWNNFSHVTRGSLSF